MIPFIQKFNVHPVTKEPLKLNQIAKLNFCQNEWGEFTCPISKKVFTENSHIIAIRETGNVYSWETYCELNKEHHFDLLNDKPFDPANVIVLQDPKNPKKNVDVSKATALAEIEWEKKGDDDLMNLTTTDKWLLDEIK